MESSRFLNLVGRWRRVVIACTLLAALAAWAVTLIIPPTYEGRAVVLVGSALSSVTLDREQLDVSQQLTQTYATIALSRPLLERVAGEVGVDARDLEVRVTSEQDPPVISIAANGRTADEAAAIANAIVAELISASPSHGDEEENSREFITRQLAEIENEIEATNEEIDRLIGIPRRTAPEEEELAAARLRLTNLQTTYASLLTADARRGSNVLTVLEEAVPLEQPVAPRPIVNTLLAALVGFALSLVLVLLRERFKEAIHSSEDAEAALGLPTVGVIPRLPSIGGRIAVLGTPGTGPNAIGREAFVNLQANIELLVGPSLATLLVTSASQGEGKTAVAVNLAASYARSGRRVILVDTDLQHPSVHRHFGVHHRYGVSDFLRSTDLDPVDLLQGTMIERLGILPAGQAAMVSLQLIGAPRMRELLERLAARADVIVVDGPSIVGVSETAVLASFVDATLLVVNAGVTRRPTLQAARDALANIGAAMVGIALNDARGTHARLSWSPPWASRGEADRTAIRGRGT